MPLWWRDDRIEGLEVRTLHDGKQLAIHLSWQDATRDDASLAVQQFTDGAAIQFSASENPPLFAMGDKQGEVVIWHWKATAHQPADLLQKYPHMDTDNLGSPTDEAFQTGAAAGNLVSDPKRATPVEHLAARGFGTLTSRGPGAQNVRGGARWADGQWQVVFVRDLKTSDGGIVFDSQQPLSIGLAAWDGSAGDRNGQKSVTIWHRLALEAK
jgi:hypothetical protein